MELVEKGKAAALESLNSLVVKMTWTTPTDFDLAAMIEKKNGTNELIYFGNKGNLNSHPFIALDRDAGVGDTVDDSKEGNEETVRIHKLDDVNKVHLLCWDYEEIKKGEHARFKESDLKMVVIDDQKRKHSVSLDSGEFGNVVYLACIDNSLPTGASFINTSKVTTLKEFPHDSKEFMSVIN